MSIKVRIEQLVHEASRVGRPDQLSVLLERCPETANAYDMVSMQMLGACACRYQSILPAHLFNSMDICLSIMQHCEATLSVWTSS